MPPQTAKEQEELHCEAAEKRCCRVAQARPSSTRLRKGAINDPVSVFCFVMPGKIKYEIEIYDFILYLLFY